MKIQNVKQLPLLERLRGTAPWVRDDIAKLLIEAADRLDKAVVILKAGQRANFRNYSTHKTWSEFVDAFLDMVGAE